MLQLDTRSNRFIATIGTGVALLLALNLGILIHSHFLMPPYNAAEVITYFLAFSGAIAFTIYKTVDVLHNPDSRYVEGIVMGTFGSTAMLLYLPSVFFEPLVSSFPSVFPFFAAAYLFSVGITAVLIAGVVKGSELYCESPTGSQPDLESIADDSLEEYDDDNKDVDEVDVDEESESEVENPPAENDNDNDEQEET